MSVFFPGPRVAAALAIMLGAAATGASAQYKVVAPDGSVTFTDRPPAGAAATTGAPSTATATSTMPAATAPTPPAAGAGTLPYALRQPALRYPVALYASHGCVPCDQARQWLKGRGVPYSEYSVEQPGDIAALKARFGDAQLPVVTIGTQVLKGFSTADLQSYITAAGYPGTSLLAGHAWPTPVPLAPPAAPAPVAPVNPAPAPVAPPAPAPAQPRTGIQF